MTWPECAAEMWQQGHTDASIGRAVGISRQAVQQYHKRHLEHFGERPWDSGLGAARHYGVQPNTVRAWVHAGAIRLSPAGLVCLPDVEETFEALKARPCEYPGCKDVIGRYGSADRFCMPHSLAVRQYQYPAIVSDPEALARFQEQQRSWRERNPERAREIQRRAVRAYQQRKREGREHEARPHVRRQVAG